MFLVSLHPHLHLFVFMFAAIAWRIPIPNRPPTCSFRGKSFFSANQCDESGGAVYNGEDSKMT